jgi:hypothetical protein
MENMKRRYELALVGVICLIIVTVGNGSVFAQTAQSFSIDRNTVFAGDSAKVTVTLVNNNSYGGTVSEGFSIPSNVAASCSVTGGEGALYLQAGETQTITLLITNTGNLAQDTLAAFTYHVYNADDDTLFSKTVQLTFKAGLGVPETTLNVTVKDGSTNKPLDVLVQAYYDVNYEGYRFGDSNDGLVTLDLGTYTGQVLVNASDPQGHYLLQSQLLTVTHGNNAFTIYMVTNSALPTPKANNSEQICWGLLVVLLAAVIIVIGLTNVFRRKARLN